MALTVTPASTRPTGKHRGDSLLLLLLLLFSPLSGTPARAATPPEALKNGGFWSIQLENDLWGSGDDQLYSHGTEVAYFSLNRPPGWLTRLGEGLPFFRTGDVSAVQYAVGQKIFTPQDTDSRTLVSNDRPYAGWLYGNATLWSRYVDEADLQVDNLLGVTVGIVGPSAQADDVQRKFHDLFDGTNPNGWDNQLRDELGILLTYTRRWQYFHTLPGGLEFETAPHLVGALGNIYTYAGGGMMLRLGKGLRNDNGPPNIAPGFPGTPYLRPSREANWYLFAGIAGRAVARNIFLDGNTFRESHSVDKEPLVADLQLGFAFHIDNIRLAISNVWRSREFEGQSGHARFGAINISYFVPY
ncbi:lipid A deacylase LpxR family protein [Sedimenticola hydrogenitrophicus]|uniref:lipid A deacylase LpxR family protein n=1 Tax=Sedimenticola hydrogenitrophicus TaxID=2967975 RepID=UPI0023B03271|nr:lipid A deacylase LpxR family protein [Sedimenticola hydrogenitrophicus]